MKLTIFSSILLSALSLGAVQKAEAHPEHSAHHPMCEIEYEWQDGYGVTYFDTKVVPCDTLNRYPNTYYNRYRSSQRNYWRSGRHYDRMRRRHTRHYRHHRHHHRHHRRYHRRHRRH